MPSGVAEGFFRGTRTTTSDDRFDPRVAVELPSQDVLRKMVLLDYDLCVFPPLVVPLFIAEQHERSSRLEPGRLLLDSDTQARTVQVSRVGFFIVWSNEMEAIIFTGLQGSGKSSVYRERFFTTHMRISLDLDLFLLQISK